MLFSVCCDIVALMFAGACAHVQVQMVMLARLSVDMLPQQLVLQLIFRDPATVSRIPNYEGE